MAGERFLTRNHDEIRKWAEEREGTPAAVSSTASEDDPGIIRIDFPGYTGEGSLEEIDWEEWFEKFDDNDLVLLYQETTSDGEKSNFNKLVSADTAEEAAENARWKEGSSGRGRGGAGGDESSEPQKRVNLNKASAEELDEIFGVGPATAKRIVAYREEELGGTFHDEHDLTHINGVGEETARMIARNSSFD